MIFQTTNKLFLIFLLFVLIGYGCSSSEDEILGVWSDGMKQIEIFEDNTWMLISLDKNNSISGTWKILDDGRVKLEANARGTQITALGRAKNGTLSISGQIKGTFYRGSVEACLQCEKDAKNISYAIATYFANPKNRKLPSENDLEVDVEYPYKVSGNPDGEIFIKVNSSGECPQKYQKTKKNWSDGVFTKKLGASN